MALTDDRMSATPPAEGGNGFDRQPPQDLTAEQSVLGGMMLSKDAIADVVEVLAPATSTGRRTSWSTTASSTCTAEVSRRTPSPWPPS